MRRRRRETGTRRTRRGAWAAGTALSLCAYGPTRLVLCGTHAGGRRYQPTRAYLGPDVRRVWQAVCGRFVRGGRLRRGRRRRFPGLLPTALRVWPEYADAALRVWPVYATSVPDPQAQAITYRPAPQTVVGSSRGSRYTRRDSVLCRAVSAYAAIRVGWHLRIRSIGRGRVRY
eukprot:457861-Rhodomonas_salina.1